MQHLSGAAYLQNSFLIALAHKTALTYNVTRYLDGYIDIIKKTISRILSKSVIIFLQ